MSEKWVRFSVVPRCNGMGPSQGGDPTAKTYGALHKGAESTRRPYRTAAHLFEASRGSSAAGFGEHEHMIQSHAIHAVALGKTSSR